MRFRLLLRPTLCPRPTLFAASVSFAYRLQPIVHKMPLVTINQSLRESLKKHEIIPDVVDDFTPTALISVNYGAEEVSLGNTIEPDKARAKPSVRIAPEGTDGSTSYTLVLTDPDAPSRDDPKWSEFCHWIATDVKTVLPSQAAAAASTQDSTSIDLERITDIIEYTGPAPPENTGKHRYVFLLFKHDGSSGIDLRGPSERKNWGTGMPRTGVRQWASKNNLTLIGANFYFSKHL